MYKPKLGCRRKAGIGGHDVRGLERCYDTERCRWSPPEGARAVVVLNSAGHHRPRASLPARRSRRHTDPHSHLQNRPERHRTKILHIGVEIILYQSQVVSIDV